VDAVAREVLRRSAVAADVEDLASGLADEEAAHAPWLVGQRVHDLTAQPSRGGMRGIWLVIGIALSTS
jgi:hypothetical protein